jgi:hypothetical protein
MLLTMNTKNIGILRASFTAAASVTSFSAMSLAPVQHPVIAPIRFALLV